MSFFFATGVYLRRNLRAVWPPNASLYANSTCVQLRLLAGPFGQGFSPGMVPLIMKATDVGVDKYIYCPTALRRIQIAPKTSTNITRYLFSRGPVRQTNWTKVMKKNGGQWKWRVFMWRNHNPKWNSTFPSQVLVSSDKRPWRNLTFHNVSARQGSSYCNRAHLNFQAFALLDMKIATREVFRVGQKMSYHYSFC